MYSRHGMQPVEEFRKQKPEFWAVVKLVSQLLGYSVRGRNAKATQIRSYTAEDVREALASRGLDASKQKKLVDRVVAYSEARAELLQSRAKPNLMDRKEAKKVFDDLRKQIEPPDYLLSMNKQKKEKRHYAYLACIVNMLTWKALNEKFGAAEFDHNPRGPLTFSRNGMPLRTLFRWMDGASAAGPVCSLARWMPLKNEPKEIRRPWKSNPSLSTCSGTMSLNAFVSTRALSSAASRRA
jgi:hypothetical protein